MQCHDDRSELPALVQPRAFVVEIFGAATPKRCYFKEGYGTLDWPGALKGAIPEKEIIIFEL
jgi:hypothetical protein